MGDERYDFLFTDPPYRIGANMGDTKVGSHKYGFFKVKQKGGFGYKGLREYRGLKERGAWVKEVRTRLVEYKKVMYRI